MSDDALTTPLLDVIRKAAERKPEGSIAELRKRFVNATAEVVVLADTSSSMTDLIGSAGMNKYEHLVVALKDILVSHPKIRLVSFGSQVKIVKDPKNLPAPCGGTPLAQALEVAAQWKPRKTIVISDGLPDNEDAALFAAQAITGQVDTIYCGPDAHPAINFLRKLARNTGGVQYQWDGYRELSSTIRGLLPAPAGPIIPPPPAA